MMTASWQKRINCIQNQLLTKVIFMIVRSIWANFIVSSMYMIVFDQCSQRSFFSSVMITSICKLSANVLKITHQIICYSYSQSAWSSSCQVSALSHACRLDVSIFRRFSVSSCIWFQNTDAHSCFIIEHNISEKLFEISDSLFCCRK